MFEFLDLVATSTLAIAAVALAREANQIATRSARVESDKLLLEWGQRTLECLSFASSLRIMDEVNISATDFDEKRRDLRARLFALKEEGILFFAKGTENAQSIPAICAISKVTDIMDGKTFHYPREGDWELSRRRQNNEIRAATRDFIKALQGRVGNEWLI
ncbi:hypothetical protein [Chelativorans intermedius]|uniref:Uncharacterized protein n=1 Tax=Chelativorans intermedius TaxID=515947 RepID=A0ABV6D8A1_9HYPH|nr:hypothetical protein [Chelativorans intermedius]MCT8996811.1 hypothetical protein [Chelativorans intermedius]